ncbi:MAG: hypothetical protein ACYDAG_13120 [Chloroflexota bacterium]
MYLRLTAQGPRAEEMSRLVGRFPERLFIREPPNARLRLILEAASPGSVSFTLLAYPEPAVAWPLHPEKLQIVDYVKERVEALSPLFRSFLDGAFGPAIQPLVQNELVRSRFELQAEMAPLAVNVRNPHIRGLFEPLGYRVELESPVFGLPAILVRLTGTQSISDVLRHLFVLIPALDKAKQPPLNDHQADLLRRVSQPWLLKHPKRDYVARCYRLRPSALLAPPVG